MIAIGNNKLKKRYITDSNGNEQEAKKVYIGTNLVHLHMQDSNNPFAYRITNDGKIGEAVSVKGEISNVKGNTISWNQMIKGLRVFAGAATVTNGLIHVYGNATVDQSPNIVTLSGHAYLVYLSYKSNIVATSFALREKVTGSLSVRVIDSANKVIGYIRTPSTGLSETFNIVCSGYTSGDFYGYISLFDLTLIYGAGNEPTTTEQFEADYERWFGKPLTYEPYNAGELIPAKTTAIKTIGFNQWDEEWEFGTIIPSNGYDRPSSVQIRNPENKKIAVIPNTSYCIKWHVNASSGNFIYFYRADGTYIGYNNAPSADFTVFTTPSDCTYLRFVAVVNESTYNNDICINLSSTRNGTYEPYEEHTLQLPITTLTGKLNGEGESVIVFPDGMKKAGSVQDEIYISGGKTYAVKRVGSVDLGTTQGWGITASGLFSLKNFAINYNAKANRDSQSPSVLVMAEYKAVGASPISGMDTEKEVALHWSEGFLYINTVGQYTDVATFTAAMQGVILYYELETPLVYELDDFELPKNYIANGLGTEELLPANDTALVTAPADMTIDYTLN